MTDLNAVFFALGDDTRRNILIQLTEGEQPLSRLAEPFEMSQTAVSRHVRVLEGAGLVTVEKRGRVRHCALTAGPMEDAVSWLESYRPFWVDRLESLAKMIAAEKNND
ncbi:metalloregulator ArsR/SmtB family transcription factor [uncultured Roseobacter sp.]|uniref:ArsR/SmtB family transcription factor n=1 Tax=uncultured Roseobacter sp. TaxID=114847 RepID=UPI0026223288|nr:metalloregulator ArsR/SmtB family transcription factor [uncultured Roseobacter sp.]